MYRMYRVYRFLFATTLTKTSKDGNFELRCIDFFLKIYTRTSLVYRAAWKCIEMYRFWNWKSIHVFSDKQRTDRILYRMYGLFSKPLYIFTFYILHIVKIAQWRHIRIKRHKYDLRNIIYKHKTNCVRHALTCNKSIHSIHNKRNRW